ncbi:MAG: amidohydrolase family protein, partial [Oscillospiraceae bacterium]|nr:amidohydrolase family protein [Oscillospiraceae bacterium]
DAMGFDYARIATQDEIDVMKKHVVEAMEAGATGLSFGLDYAPGKYAGSDELNQLAECIKSYNGILAAHIRNYGKHPDTQQEFHTIDGIKELMDIGLKHGLHVHISHIGDGFDIKPFDQFMMDASAQRTLQIIDEYRNKGLHVTWDVLVPEYIPWFFFPDLAGLVKYYIAACGGKKAFAEKLKSPAYQHEIAQAIKENKNPSFGWFKEEYEILRCKNKDYEGKTIKQIAEMLEKEPVYAMFDILLCDMDTRYRQNRLGSGRHTNVFQEAEEASMGLDNCGYDYNWEGEKPDMPVDYSTPTSYCGMITFMEKRKEFPLEDTIRKMTGNAATALGVKDRGFLKEGLAADIVVIDYKNLRSNENFTDPRCKPDGIDYVLVNGKIAVDHGVHTHVRAGVIANGLEA